MGGGEEDYARYYHGCVQTPQAPCRNPFRLQDMFVLLLDVSYYDSMIQ